MALIYGNNAGAYYLSEPPEKRPSNQFQGRRRVITDSISFAVNTVNADDDIVVARLNPGTAIYDWKVFVGGAANLPNAIFTFQWGLLDEETDGFFPISDEIVADALSTTEGTMIRQGASVDVTFGTTGPIATSIRRTLVMRVISVGAPLSTGNFKYSVEYTQD